MARRGLGGDGEVRSTSVRLCRTAVSCASAVLHPPPKEDLLSQLGDACSWRELLIVEPYRPCRVDRLCPSIDLSKRDLEALALLHSHEREPIEIAEALCHEEFRGRDREEVFTKMSTSR